MKSSLPESDRHEVIGMQREESLGRLKIRKLAFSVAVRPPHCAPQRSRSLSLSGFGRLSLKREQSEPEREERKANKGRKCVYVFFQTAAGAGLFSTPYDSDWHPTDDVFFKCL